MGTTLTGTTPQDTYDSLIKVTDNGPLSGTLKRITDGLGNDSALSLSTAAARVTGNLSVKTTTERANITTDADLVTENGIGVVATSATFGQGYQYIRFMNSSGTYSGSVSHTASTGIGLYSGSDLILASSSTERMRITAAGNVGIGTSSPNAKLDVVSTSNVRATDNSDKPYINFSNADASFFWGRVGGLLTGVGDGSLYFQTKTGAGLTEKMQLTDTGFLRLLSGTSGIQFNGDTAAANALDDYEEGTFTATLVPPTSGTITLDPTYSTWSYTKIGRKVTINGVAVISAVSSPVGAYFTMTTLPFTIITANSGYGSGSATLSDQSLSYAKSSVPIWHSVGNVALNFGLDASTIAAGDEFYVTATYFV
jgi:hypothetical protein